MRKEQTGMENANLFEGMTSLSALFAAMAAGTTDRKIERVLFARERATRKARQLAFLQHRATDYHFPIELVPLAEIETIATGNSHGGVVAFTTDRTTPMLTEAVLPPDGFFVMLDGVEDPYNFGYAVRSLYAAGVSGVVLPPRNFLGAAGLVARASAGASEQMPFFVTATAEEAVAVFRGAGYRIVCADTAHAVSVYDADLSLPLLLVVGGEKRGIRADLLAAADAVVKLEYARPFDAALSAASAATILAFEVYRRNK